MHVDTLAPLRNGSAKLRRRSQSSEREGSAHSDYFSLVEECIEPLSIKHNGGQLFQQTDTADSAKDINNILNNNEMSRISGLESALDHNNRCPSIASQNQGEFTHHSPSMDRRQRPSTPGRLQPISHKPLQSEVSTSNSVLKHSLENGNLLQSDYSLSQGMRKMRMDTLMSKIKSQKPACEIEYNTHYKAIESQHRLLLDNADVLSLYGSSDAGLQNGHDSHRAPKKSAANCKNAKTMKVVRSQSFDKDLSGKRMETVDKSSRFDSARNKNSNSVPNQAQSPFIKKKLSKSVSNLNPESIRKSLEENWKSEFETRRKSREMQESPHYGYTCSTDRNQVHSEVPRPNTISSPQGETSPLPYSCNNSERECMPSSEIQNINANFNATVSSSCDLNYSEQDQSCDTRPEELLLNIPCESQSDMISMYAEGKEELEQSLVGNESGLSQDMPYRPSDIVIPTSEVTEISTNGIIDEESNAPEKTSTPVPNLKATMTPPLHRKRGQSETSRSTLRRSQSLKNMKQQQPWDPPSSYQRGKLPRYLLARKEEERRLAEIAKSVDPDCPPGHAPLPEYERRNTLHLLRKSQAEIMRELSTLPVAQDTLRVKKKRHELEEKLMQIEDGLRIFSQPKVYVVNDE
ncbi:Enkurin domain-containing protein 1 [Halocaridina rubra]|uniref:Enkurin domain-containing protein 1 n=1 Tax=Halocaridina rubra TaxID=373956 RepID=A0AAN8WGY9_HALRR